MDVVVGKGLLLGEFESYNAKNKVAYYYYRLLPFESIFIAFFLLPLAFWALVGIDQLFQDPFFLSAYFFLIFLGIFAMFFLDKVMTPMFSSLRVYSNGLEVNRSLLDRLLRKESFFSHESIKIVTIKQFRIQMAKRKTTTGAKVILQRTKGLPIELGDRGTIPSERLFQIINERTEIPIEYWDLTPSGSDTSQRVPISPPTGITDVDTNASNIFCTTCGARLGKDENFCKSCEKKVA
jgi:hypothetical protein